MTPIEIMALIIAIVVLIKMGISLFFLLKELTIVQIFATLMFSMSLMILGFAPHSKDMLVLEDA
ncbi:MAG: hypothetical protein WC974_06110 [Thermoplasmata archaeon]